MQAQANDQRRRAELAKIHIAKKQLGLDDAAYRDAVRRASRGRTESAGELKPTERGVLLDIFAKGGFKQRRGKAGPRRAAADRPQAAKICALWYSLWLLGEVEHRGDKAIDAFCKRQTGVEALAWLKPAQANQVIEALKEWCHRAGFEAETTDGDGGEATFIAKRKLAETLWRRLGFQESDLEGWMARQGWRAHETTVPHLRFGESELDACAEILGRELRATKGLPS